MQKNDRFGKEWSSSSAAQEYPTDQQAQQGLSFLGATPPSFNLHDAMFMASDWKDNWLFDQIKGVTDAYGQTLDLSVAGDRTALADAVAKAITDSLTSAASTADSKIAAHAQSRNHPAATTAAQGMTQHATSAETVAGTRTDRTSTPAGVKAALDDRIADQATVDAGANDTKFITPLKLKNWVKQATESVMGLLKVATQAQVDAGTDDATAVTPKKLRWGVSYGFGVASYVAMPSWLGGIIVQWGGISTTPGSLSYNVDVTFPIAFPVRCDAFVSSCGINDYLDTDPSYRAADQHVTIGLPRTNGIDVQLIVDDGDAGDSRIIRWVAVGR